MQFGRHIYFKNKFLQVQILLRTFMNETYLELTKLRTKAEHRQSNLRRELDNKPSDSRRLDIQRDLMYHQGLIDTYTLAISIVHGAMYKIKS